MENIVLDIFLINNNNNNKVVLVAVLVKIRNFMIKKMNFLWMKIIKVLIIIYRKIREVIIKLKENLMWIRKIWF